MHTSSHQVTRGQAPSRCSGHVGFPPPRARPWKQQPLLFPRLREGRPLVRGHAAGRGRGVLATLWLRVSICWWKSMGAAGQPQPPIRGLCTLPPAQSLRFPVLPRDTQLLLVRPAQRPGHRPVPNRPSPLGTLFLLPSQGRHSRRARRGQCQLQGLRWGQGGPWASVSPALQGEGRAGLGGGHTLCGACPHRSLKLSPAPAGGLRWPQSQGLSRASGVPRPLPWPGPWGHPDGEIEAPSR